MKDIDNLIFKDELTLDDFIKLREAFPIVDTENEVMMAKMQKFTLSLLCDDKSVDFGAMPLSRILRITSAMAPDIKKKMTVSLPVTSAIPTST